MTAITEKVTYVCLRTDNQSKVILSEVNKWLTRRHTHGSGKYSFLTTWFQSMLRLYDMTSMKYDWIIFRMSLLQSEAAIRVVVHKSWPDAYLRENEGNKLWWQQYVRFMNWRSREKQTLMRTKSKNIAALAKKEPGSDSFLPLVIEGVESNLYSYRPDIEKQLVKFSPEAWLCRSGGWRASRSVLWWWTISTKPQHADLFLHSILERVRSGVKNLGPSIGTSIPHGITSKSVCGIRLLIYFEFWLRWKADYCERQDSQIERVDRSKWREEKGWNRGPIYLP